MSDLFAARAGRIRRQSPYGQRNLSRWLARHGIERALAEGGLPDPFYGDYRILPQQQVLVLNAAQARRYQVDLLGAELRADSVGRYRLTAAGRHQGGAPVDSRRLALASADFDGDGRDELAWLVEDQGKLELTVARVTDDGIRPMSTTTLPYQNVGRVTLLTGVFEDLPHPQLLLSWVGADATVHLELFQVDGGRPVPLGHATLDRLESATDRYGLAAGDPTGGGLSWVAYGRCTGGQLRLRMYRAEGDGFVAYPPVDLGPAPGRRAVALAFGDLNGDAGEELAVVWERAKDRVSVQLVAVAADGMLIPRGRWDDSDADTALTGVGCLAVATGYLGAAGALPGGRAPADQLVVGYETGEHHVTMRLFQTDEKLNLGPKYLKASTVLGDALPYWLLTYDLVIRCGNLQGGALNAVVVGAIGTSRNPFVVLGGYATVTVGLLPVTPDLSAFGELDVNDCHTYDLAQDGTGRFTLGLTLADPTGKSLVVGRPRVRQANDVNQVLAVVNAPPLHVVNRDGHDPININFDGMSSVTFENSQGHQTELSSELRKDWGYSRSLRGMVRTPVASIEASLAQRYGESFSKVSTNTVRTSLRLSKDYLWTEDAVILVSTAYTVWEYDVYDGPGGSSIGQIAVAFPADIPPTVRTEGSKDMLFGYYADHSVGDALSYRVPTDLPDDYSASRLLGAASLAVGASPTDLVIDWESTDNAGTVRETSQAIEVGLRLNANPQFRGFGLGIDVDLEGTYAENEMSSIRTTMENTTTIMVHYDRLYNDASFRYSVMPIVYWSKRWGYLVVDYLVNIPSDKLYPTAWDRVYGDACDLGFALPWLDGSDGPEYRHLTRDVYLTHDPDSDEITAEVTVSNTGLRAVQDVRVDLYDGPPEHGHRLHTHRLPEIGPRARATFAHSWPAKPGRHDIWAVVDPEQAQPDLYRENNTGWARLIVLDDPAGRR